MDGLVLGILAIFAFVAIIAGVIVVAAIASSPEALLSGAAMILPWGVMIALIAIPASAPDIISGTIRAGIVAGCVLAAHMYFCSDRAERGGEFYAGWYRFFAHLNGAMAVVAIGGALVQGLAPGLALSLCAFLTVIASFVAVVATIGFSLRSLEYTYF